MSGVFSMASHWVLQYLPEVVVHEQIGCAHLCGVSGAIWISYFEFVVIYLSFDRNGQALLKLY
jgi:hypothetical protein